MPQKPARTSSRATTPPPGDLVEAQHRIVVCHEQVCQLLIEFTEVILDQPQLFHRALQQAAVDVTHVCYCRESANYFFAASTVIIRASVKVRVTLSPTFSPSMFFLSSTLADME